MVLEVFGDILYYPESKHLQEFPSPEALKGRVLLSTKPPKEYLEAKGSTMKDREIEPQFKKGEREEAAWGVEVPDIQDEMQIADRVQILNSATLYLCFLSQQNFCPSVFTKWCSSRVKMIYYITKGVWMITIHRKYASMRHQSINISLLSRLESQRVHSWMP